MAEVIANVWYWTQAGMSETPPPAGAPVGYIESHEVERLLRDAHRIGFQQGREAPAPRTGRSSD